SHKGGRQQAVHGNSGISSEGDALKRVSIEPERQVNGVRVGSLPTAERNCQIVVRDERTQLESDFTTEGTTGGRIRANPPRRKCRNRPRQQPAGKRAPARSARGDSRRLHAC